MTPHSPPVALPHSSFIWLKWRSCFPNPFSLAGAARPLALLLSSSSPDTGSVRRPSPCDSWARLHSAFLSGDVMTSDFWLTEKTLRRSLLSPGPLKILCGSHGPPCEEQSLKRPEVKLLWPRPAGPGYNAEGHETFLCRSDSSHCVLGPCPMPLLSPSQCPPAGRT